MTAARARTVRAFAPGHVTGVFRPQVTSRDPRGRGSVGAGLVLELGAWAEARFSPGSSVRVSVTGDGPGPWPISEEVARRLARGLAGRVRVRLSHELPVGQGFGMSAAGALATALSVGALAGEPRRRSVEVAHLADLFGGGGLGGVAAILGGGLEVRLRAGVPPFGRVLHRPLGHPFFVGVVGRPIPSPSVLGDTVALRRIARAARGWETLQKNPSARRFFPISERFSDRAGLSSPAVARVVRELRHRGAWAGQAMFGESFFAVPRSRSAKEECLHWLRDEGVRAVEIRTATVGARVVRTALR
jgi:pantoate kinase